MGLKRGLSASTDVMLERRVASGGMCKQEKKGNKKEREDENCPQGNARRKKGGKNKGRSRSQGPFLHKREWEHAAVKKRQVKSLGRPVLKGPLVAKT